MQRSRNPSQLGLRQVTLVALNSTHHLMLHRARAGWTGLPGTQKSSSHSISILNIYSESLLLCEWLLCSSKAVNGDPWRVSWAGERHRHGLPSLISHWLCCNPGPIGTPVPHNSISSPAATGCWHHNPQIYSTKAAGEVLIPNPRESIHFSPASPRGAHRRAARADKDGTSTRWVGVIGLRLLARAWAEKYNHSGCSEFGSSGWRSDRWFGTLSRIEIMTEAKMCDRGVLAPTTDSFVRFQNLETQSPQ